MEETVKGLLIPSYITSYLTIYNFKTLGRNVDKITNKKHLKKGNHSKQEITQPEDSIRFFHYVPSKLQLEDEDSSTGAYSEQGRFLKKGTLR